MIQQRNHAYSLAIAFMLSSICLVQPCRAQEARKTVMFHGSKVVYSSESAADTQVIVDPVSGNTVTKIIHHDPVPEKINDTRIYTTDRVMLEPKFPADKGPFEMYVLKGLMTDLKKLPDGVYYLDLYDIVVDNKGKIVFYQYNGLFPDNKKIKEPSMAIKRAVDKKVEELINKAPAFKPGKVNGFTVAVRTDIFLNFYKIHVKKHKVTFVNK